MENKEVEYLIKCLLPKDKTSINYGCIEGVIGNIIANFEQLEKDNEALKQQLVAKDKALDKMIESRELVDDCPPMSTPERIKCDNYGDADCIKCWKEWAEHE